jgi:acetyl esterase/lipase
MDKQSAPGKPRFGENGTVYVPAFELPPSELSSPEARAAQAMRAKMPESVPPADADITVVRDGLEAMLAPQVARMCEIYPVDVAEQSIGGVRAHAVTPKGKPHDEQRVLINLHGGGFSMCAEACALLESIPVAALGGYKVITVDYRMAPEAIHPAAVQDLEIVYRELLKRYEARRIGIFGCSAGGSLTAQAAAWLPAHGLPQPGAIGIFGAGGVRFSTGDSAHVTAYIDGTFPAPPKPGERGVDITRGYFAGSDLSDPIISPALHPDVLAQFPPTLIITGTRAMDMSPAVYTNSQLLKAGVRSTLIVGEAMGHCYIYQPELPEARDAHQAIVSFFRETLQ